MLYFVRTWSQVGLDTQFVTRICISISHSPSLPANTRQSKVRKSKQRDSIRSSGGLLGHMWLELRRGEGRRGGM